MVRNYETNIYISIKLYYKTMWKCVKCDKYICNSIDLDYHYNTVHPNWNDKFVVSWYANGCKGISPYD